MQITDFDLNWTYLTEIESEYGHPLYYAKTNDKTYPKSAQEAIGIHISLSTVKNEFM